VTLSAKRPERNYWFPAKRYGWGWGPPTAWQGWVVIALWVIVTTIGAVLLARDVAYVLAFVALMAGALIAIGYAKGEPPRWRWGDRDR